MRELLRNNSLFVGQLCEDESLALLARGLIFFTTDLQTVDYLELIYFLIKGKNICHKDFLLSRFDCHLTFATIHHLIKMRKTDVLLISQKIGSFFLQV